MIIRVAQDAVEEDERLRDALVLCLKWMGTEDQDAKVARQVLSIRCNPKSRKCRVQAGQRQRQATG